jgi:hypothetical protein
MSAPAMAYDHSDVPDGMTLREWRRELDAFDDSLNELNGALGALRRAIRAHHPSNRRRLWRLRRRTS